MAKKARKAAARSRSRRRRAARPPRAARRRAAARRNSASKRAAPSKRGRVRPRAAKSAAKTARQATRPKKAAARKPPSAPARPAAAPTRIQRERRRLPDSERMDSSREFSDSRMLSAARAGHDELRAELQRHTETSPELTAGDIDARWQDAYAVGDEAPGGDNPTPDQDRVDDIGKAFGIEYENSDDLLGGDELAERDKHRWELDPASADDWPHDKLK